jgi:hypothetical protein
MTAIEPTLDNKEATARQMIEDGKLLEDEEDEVIKVEAKTYYYRYLQMPGGWLTYISLKVVIVGNSVYVKTYSP